MLRLSILLVLFCQSQTVLGTVSIFNGCSTTFMQQIFINSRVDPAATPKAVDILKKNLSRDELIDRYVRSSLWDFDEVPASTERLIESEVFRAIKDPAWRTLLANIQPGEWAKVIVVLGDGREIHYYYHSESNLSAFPKWK